MSLSPFCAVLLVMPSKSLFPSSLIVDFLFTSFVVCLPLFRACFLLFESSFSDVANFSSPDCCDSSCFFKLQSGTPVWPFTSSFLPDTFLGGDFVAAIAASFRFFTNAMMDICLTLAPVVSDEGVEGDCSFLFIAAIWCFFSSNALFVADGSDVLVFFPVRISEVGGVFMFDLSSGGCLASVDFDVLSFDFLYREVDVLFKPTLKPISTCGSSCGGRLLASFFLPFSINDFVRLFSCSLFDIFLLFFFAFGD